MFQTIATTFRRYHAPDVPEGFRDHFAECLAANGFRDLGEHQLGTSVGWVRLDDPLSSDFTDLNTWLYDRYLVVGLRIDTRNVSGKLRKALLAQRCAAWCREHLRSRCPGAVRTELAELLDFELAAKTLPTMTVIPVVWNVVDNYVLFHNQADKKINVFVKLFHETFGIPAEPWSVAEWLPQHLKPNHEWLSVESHAFYLWLWFMTELRGCRLRLPDLVVDAWVDSKLVFGTDGTPKAVTLAGENPASYAEAAAALRNQRRLSEMSFCIRRDEREFAFSFVPDYGLKSVKLPQVVSGDGEEALYDRMFLYEELHSILGTLFTSFAVERSSTDWAYVMDDIHEWMEKK